MANLSNILTSVASLVSQRDTDLLDFSLVKTIFTFANISDALTVKAGRAGRVVSIIKYEKGLCKKIEADSFFDVSIADAIERIRLLDRDELYIKNDDIHLNLFLLARSRGIDTFLIVRSAESFSPQQTLLMQGFSQIYKNYYALLLDSQRDQLTGLPNRKTFDEYLNKISSLNQLPLDDEPDLRKGLNYWLVLIDIDNFKNINDIFGHLYGDEVLIHVSNVLLTSIRDGDAVFRFGGEEFVMVISADDEQECRVAVDRIRYNVSQKQISQVGAVTISLGVAKFNDKEFYLTIIDRADKALYASKKAGKNKVSFYEDLIFSGEISEVDIKFGDVDLF